MLKFIRGKGQQPSAERQKLQRELFAFRKTVQHGFPNKPTALTWDPVLRLLAVGTASGAIKVFGKPGVEFYGQHKSHDSAVTRLIFLPNEGRIISLCDDNSLHLWEINNGTMEEVHAQSLEGKLKRISAVCLESSLEHLLLGTEGGNIYLLNVKTFQISETIIYQDVVMQNVPEDYKINPGAVEAIAEQPGNPHKILIGYNRGLMVLWDRKSPGAEQTYISTQQLESVCWHQSGMKFASSHNDGSFAYWDVSVGERPLEEPSTLYGPFPCKAVTKLLWRHDKNDDFIIFSGGMPRASYSDRHTVTVKHGEKHAAFDFTSKVIDFFTIEVDSENKEFDTPDSLIVLLEEELVAIDLCSEDWKMMSLPYLVSLHASAITCSQHVSDVPQELWDKIVSSGKTQTSYLYTDREWPVTGGSLLCGKTIADTEEERPPPRRELLLTGHEDGTIRFWDATGVALQPICKFQSANLFSGDEIVGEGTGEKEEDEEEEWPPFVKVGTFDPYSDDPRLAVKKVVLCPFSGTLVVAGTAGSIIVAKIGMESIEKEVKVTTMNIVLDRDGFVWKGHDQLTPRTGALRLTPGFQPQAILQLHPPAAVTAVVLHSEWGVVAAGTAHGLALFDYVRHKGVLTKCTLNPNDLSGAGDAPISRRKSFKKSLRESFRRLRKGRSTRRTDKRGAQSPTSPIAGDKKVGDSSSPSTAPMSPIEAKPVERSVEARTVDDSLGSMVRCLYFAKTYIISVQATTPTLWAGTNNGTIYVFTIAPPTSSKRSEEDVTCQLAKEIQLKHRAPVISVVVIDGNSGALAEPLDPSKHDNPPPHRVVIISEEQFKIFTLPSLKPFGKFKLTAHEGSRVRRMGLLKFKTPDERYSENCLVCLTNLGDCVILSIPDLKRQLNATVIKREDINGISSLTFTSSGEALYLHSSSELQRISFSTAVLTQPRCYLNLPEGARVHEVITVDDDDNEQEIEGKAEEAGDREQEQTPPQVNGIDHISKDESEPKVESPEDTPKENGTEEVNDLSISVGDITIDSVKDHLINSSNITEEIRTSSEKTEHGSIVTTQTVIVKSTVISSSNETRAINTAGSGDIAVETCLAGGPLTPKNTEISLLRAPLAKMEDLDN